MTKTYMLKWGVIGVVANALLFCLLYWFPNLLGRSLAAGDMGTTRFADFVITLNYPIVWVLDALTPKDPFSPNYTVMQAAPLVFFPLYWFIVGCIVGIILAELKSIIRRGRWTWLVPTV